jgi:hypothetical protein
VADPNVLLRHIPGKPIQIKGNCEVRKLQDKLVNLGV